MNSRKRKVRFEAKTARASEHKSQRRLAEPESSAPEVPPTAPAIHIPASSDSINQIIADGFKRLGSAIDAIKTDVNSVRDRVDQIEAEGPEAKAANRIDPNTAKGMSEGAVKELVEAQFKGALQGYAETVQRRLDGIEAAQERLALAAGDAGQTEVKSLAERIHGSEQFAAYREAKASGRPHDMRLVGPEYSIHSRERKAAVTLGAAELGPLLVPFHRTSVVEPLVESSGFASLIPRIPVGGRDTYDFRRETDASSLGYVTTTIGAAVAPTDTSVTVGDTNGFVEDTVVRFFVGGSVFTHYVSIADATTLDLLDAPGGSPAQAGFTSVSGGERVTSENYGVTAENAEKPFGWLEFETVTVTLKTIATVLGLTQQRMDSLAQFDRFVEGKLVMRHNRNLSYQLLYGDDGANELAGLASETGVMTYAWSTGVTGDTRADAVLRAMDEIHDDNQLIVTMNKRDWTRIMLEKSSSDGHYINTNRGPVLLVDSPGRRFLGPILVNLDGACREGDFFLVDHSQASEWPDAEASGFAMGFINDDFIYNRLKVRYEDKLNQAILATSAYVHGSWDAPPA